MKIHQIGDKSQGICEKCGLVPTTFKIRDVPVKNEETIVKNILVAICDKCDSIVGIPQQSVSEIKNQL